ncbi:tautomerase family protein [Gorillibacterium timonense]|uniref:tautomerase family protein n=1 Tax=Gorillibacterium timonense TaxID=1689269 RepID=UPI00071E6507|nr:tautomerase family protein [Gorillibacterium timonense]
MPIIQVKLTKGRSVEQKQRFAQAVTRAAAEHLGVREEWVSLIFDEYERDNWATGGTLHSIKFEPGHGKQGAGESAQ